MTLFCWINLENIMLMTEDRFGFVSEDNDSRAFKAQTNEEKELAAVIHSMRQLKTLKEVGLKLQELSGKGKWKEWELSYWDKCGQCRLYLRRSGLKRGFIRVLNNAMINYDHVVEYKGDKFPRITFFIPYNLESLPNRKSKDVWS